MNICVVGSGYVGLVTGACLADFGMHVVGVDKDHAKVEALSRGKVPIYEPGLETLVQKNMEEGRLRFTTDLGPAIEEAQAIFIAVGTPPKPDGSADLTFIREVAASIAEHLNGYKIIDHQEHGADRHRPDDRGDRRARARAAASTSFAVVCNPEFLREGSAIDDFMHPDRVVIGTRDQRAVELMLDVYSPLARRRRAVRHHRRRDRRADQVRLERLPGHQDLLHQRGRPDLRGAGGRRRGGGAGHGARQPDRPEVPPRRPRLRRLLLPQGHPRRGPDRPRLGAPVPHHRGGARGQRGDPEADGREDRPRRSAAAPARRSPSSASPSSRTPTTSASRRPSRSCRRCSTAAPPCAPSTRRRWTACKPLFPDRGLLRRRLRGRRGRRRAGHRHRVEPVPQARPRRACAA